MDFINKELFSFRYKSYSFVFLCVRKNGDLFLIGGIYGFKN